MKRRWTSCRRRSSSARTAGAWRWAAGGTPLLEVRDAATLDLRSTVELVSPDRLTDLSWSADGGLLLTVGEGGGLQVVDTHTWQARAPAFASDASRLQIEWLRDGRTVAITSAGGTVRLFDVDRSVARSGLPAAVGNVGDAVLHGARPDRSPRHPG